MSTRESGKQRFNIASKRPFFACAPKDRPDVIAHRGGAGEWPPETIFAFRKAIERGVDVLEFDVRRTADDAIVLMHNPTVDETTNGSGFVRHQTLEELKKLNAAKGWNNLRSKHIDIPTLAEVFALLKEFPTLRFICEIKDRDIWLANAVGQLIGKERIEDNVLVASGWDSVLMAFRRDYPRVATSASVLEILAFKTRLNLVAGNYLPNTDAIQWRSRFVVPVITRSFVKRARSLDLIIHPWTVNTSREMKRMIKLGVDGIITDRPTELMKILGLI
jgi:glycerophosphoryl diester phosphodiesterase